jgi:2-oxoglutarate/2-oxoacid ferredoxin oxidoreductase subunit beta
MTTISAPEPVTHRPCDYASSQEVRWCPGCGSFSVLAQIKKALSTVNADPDKVVFISGIGCSSRFPYYMGTYGIHGIHGRAPSIASGLRLVRPDLDVWIITGDGDGLSIGGNHLLHTIRRNLNVKIVLFNNRIYGLTKGQISPTSEQGKRTVSTPYGSLGAQINPCAVAIGFEATFAARSVDKYPQHLQKVLERAARHRGAAFVEVYQDCPTFNDDAFKYASDRQIRDDNVVELEHGKPLIFGRNRDKGIRMTGCHTPEVVTIGENGVKAEDVLIHDEKSPSSALASMLSRLRYPEFPEPIGVFRAVEGPGYDTLMDDQIQRLTTELGDPDLDALLRGPEAYTVA